VSQYRKCWVVALYPNPKDRPAYYIEGKPCHGSLGCCTVYSSPEKAEAVGIGFVRAVIVHKQKNRDRYLRKV